MRGAFENDEQRTRLAAELKRLRVQADITGPGARAPHERRAEHRLQGGSRRAEARVRQPDCPLGRGGDPLIHIEWLTHPYNESETEVVEMCGRAFTNLLVGQPPLEC